eukprot:7556785-Prorocentrum_lima.AAC.1
MSHAPEQAIRDAQTTGCLKELLGFIIGLTLLTKLPYSNRKDVMRYREQQYMQLGRQLHVLKTAAASNYK